MRRYRLHEDVREDLDAVWRYIAERASPTIASRLEDEFFQIFSLLAEQPAMGFRRPNLTSQSLRFWPLQDYLIAYAPEYDPLFIVAVVHGRQHPQTIARILAGRQ